MHNQMGRASSPSVTAAACYWGAWHLEWSCSRGWQAGPPERAGGSHDSSPTSQCQTRRAVAEAQRVGRVGSSAAVVRPLEPLGRPFPLRPPLAAVGIGGAPRPWAEPRLPRRPACLCFALSPPPFGWLCSLFGFFSLLLLSTSNYLTTSHVRLRTPRLSSSTLPATGVLLLLCEKHVIFAFKHKFYFKETFVNGGGKPSTFTRLAVSGAPHSLASPSVCLGSRPLCPGDRAPLQAGLETPPMRLAASECG